LSTAPALRNFVSPGNLPERFLGEVVMFYHGLHVTFIGIVATLVDSVVVAEFAGSTFRTCIR
jgi:hypothetical protein